MSDEQEAAPAEAPEEAEQERPSLDEVRARRAVLEAKIEEFRAVTETEVLKAWTSPWRGPDAVKAKVDARLASNPDFRATLTEAREMTVLEAELDPNYVDANAGRQAGGHPAIGRG